MHIFLVKTPDNFLAPFSQYDEQIIDRRGDGEVLRLRLDKERDPKYHATFFAFMRMLWIEVEAIQHVYPTADHLRLDLMEQAGFIKTYEMPDGRLITEVQSISWEECDQTEFERIVSGLMDYVIQNFLPRYFKDDLQRMMDEVVNFAHGRLCAQGGE